VRFPAPPSAQCAVSSADNGEAAYEAGSQCLHWQLPVIDSSTSSGTLEFAAKADLSTLLPFTFEATLADSTCCPMDILECYHQTSKEAIGFGCTKNVTYNFTIGG